MSMETIKTEYQSELALVEDAKQLSEFWAKYLGKGGQVQKLMEGIKNVPNEEKKAYGQAVNQIKNWAQALYDEKKEEMDKKALLARYEDEAIDVTLPGIINSVIDVIPSNAYVPMTVIPSVISIDNI